ncbi:MAG TPA: M55 family metallopeptidase [Hypericibacter adhaerens]|uniref:Amino acid amidase n=1 Tax=Hypericibacter adhaerens TaxID=2602016 RepID=A0A5J6N1Y1_9PROT|nr:M55 family metallopeptidase [Hypericibacter adhaerens]QEX22590.1 amino acid amidase [Hypericibacter adhaerens]HWA41896.1 M55 family metallopeptidase [Hypericibacter adhaerens]
MKVYISADIEGIAGIAHWDEANRTHPAYPEFREEMTREVVAACEGAAAVGATDILIKDAHSSGRNILVAELPEYARIVRGWSGHPYSMIQELDESFDALVLIGYHSRAGAESNPLAHTMSLKVAEMRINGQPASEFMLQTYAAATYGVPVAFVSGDEGLCADVKKVNEKIGTFAISRGVGHSTISVSPARALRGIREGVSAALQEDLGAKKIRLPNAFTLEIKFSDPVQAYKASFYPGATHKGDRVIAFETGDFLDVMRAVKFTLRD